MGIVCYHLLGEKLEDMRATFGANKGWKKQTMYILQMQITDTSGTVNFNKRNCINYKGSIFAGKSFVN